jgi:hypothetical protein
MENFIIGRRKRHGTHNLMRRVSELRAQRGHDERHAEKVDRIAGPRGSPDPEERVLQRRERAQLFPEGLRWDVRAQTRGAKKMVCCQALCVLEAS